MNVVSQFVNVLAKLRNVCMIEFLLLMGLAWVSYKWLLTPSDSDIEDYIVMSEFSDDDFTI